ncbi:MAG: hypothetical protein NTV34_05670, partial [Proteobacteria bacterium]|nr:hypothetical protein [Pseudomonadota bacterium]
MKYLFLLSFSMFSCSHKSAKESNNQVAISHEGGPSTEQEGNQRQEASPELEQSGSKQESNSVDAENPLSSSLPPYSTSCSEYPCYYRQNKVPPNTFITNGIIGYDVKGTYEFDFRTGVPKYPNNTGDSRKATIPRGRILVLSDGRVVIRANNGAINWFKDQVAQFSVMTLTADEIKTGSNFPLGTLALMADDSIVSANKSGDIRWFKDGKLIHEEKKSDIVNLLELPGDRLAILQRTSISVFSKTKLESEIQITSDLINASIFASMNLSTFAISTKKDGI